MKEHKKKLSRIAPQHSMCLVTITACTSCKPIPCFMLLDHMHLAQNLHKVYNKFLLIN